MKERVIRNTVLYTLPKFVSYGLNLMVLPVLTRALAPEDFGIVTLSMALPSITVSVVTAGMSFSVPRYFFDYRKDETGLKSLYFTAQLYLFAALIVSGIAVYALRGWLSYISIGDDSYGNAVFITYMALYLGQINLLYLRLFQGMEKAAVHSVFVILQSVSGLLIGLVLVLYFDLSFMGLIYGTLAGAALPLIPMAFMLNRRGGFWNGRILSECLKYGFQVVPKSFTGFVNRFFDKYMLNSMLSTQAVGIYNIGQTVANSLDVLGSNLWMSLQTEVYTEALDKGPAAAARIGRIFTKFAYMTLIPLIFCALFAAEVMGILAPPSFHEASGVIVVLAAGVSTQALGISAGFQFAYSKRPFWIFPSSVMGMAANVVLNIVLIPRIGLAGASAAASLSTVVVNLFLACIGQRFYRIGYEYRALAEFYLIMALSIAVSLSPITGVVRVFAAASVLAAYLLAGIRAGVITRELPGLIKSSLSPARLKGEKA